MFELKTLSSGAIPAALAKAERYRLLNEAVDAESICLDVLRLEPDNQDALVTLLLALTDQFQQGSPELVGRAREVLPRLRDQYQRAYYDGIICERRAKALLVQGAPGFGAGAYHWLRQAMTRYDAAAALRPPGNDEAVLRWNTCARLLERHPSLTPLEQTYEPEFLE